MPPASRYQRKIIIVDRRFQLKYSLLFAGAGALLTGASTSLILLQIRHLESVAVIQPELRPALESLEAWSFAVFLAGAGLSALVLGLLALVLTHRIAGPVYAITRYLAAIARGERPMQRALRETDELKDLFELLRGAVDTLRAHDVEEVFKLEQAIVKISALPSDSQEVVRALRELQDRKKESTSLSAPAPGSRSRS